MVCFKPKLFVKFSLPLNRVFSYNFSLKKLDELKKVSKPFLELLEKNEEKIVELIPKFTGFKWQRGVIFIYVCKNFPLEGISDPLILKFNSDTDMMIYHLLHELVHINLINDEIFLLSKKVKLLKPGHTGLEIIVSLVVKYILTEIWNKAKTKKIIEKDIKTHKVHEKVWVNAENLGWDLSKTSLKEYLEKI